MVAMGAWMSPSVSDRWRVHTLPLRSDSSWGANSRITPSGSASSLETHENARLLDAGRLRPSNLRGIASFRLGQRVAMTGLESVLIIHPEGNTLNNPTLKCIVDMLKDNNVSVTIRYGRSHAPMSVAGVRLLPWGRRWNRLKHIICNRLCSSSLSFILVGLERLFLYGSYDLIIGVDRLGVIDASHLSRMTGTPFLFFSFEIMFASETSRSFKELERKACAGVSSWFAQDAVRAKCLVFENDLKISNCILLPLASSGPPQRSADRLRDILGIPQDKKVAIVMGSLTKWAMTEEVVLCAQDWPEEWVLIVHDRYARTREFFERCPALSAVDPRKVFLSGSAANSVDDMGRVLGGVSVGLAFYRPDRESPFTGLNLQYLGLSSGKIATFLRHRIPVIMNAVGLYSELAERKQFGVVVHDCREVGPWLALADWDRLAGNASEFFATQLDFENYKTRVLTIFREVAAKGVQVSDR